jgi:3-deoxy-7-phosphoheptulonate synthase
MIDFSHANSKKKFENQMLVSTDVSGQISQGNKNIFGVMVESHLVEGNQSLVNGKAQVYGQSITDACIGWEDTEILLSQLNEAVISRRNIID